MWYDFKKKIESHAQNLQTSIWHVFLIEIIYNFDSII